MDLQAGRGCCRVRLGFCVLGRCVWVFGMGPPWPTRLFWLWVPAPHPLLREVTDRPVPHASPRKQPSDREHLCEDVKYK